MSSWPEKVLIYTDGASRGNPVPASVGISVVDAETRAEIDFWAEPLGIQTNNFAKYYGVVKALELAQEKGAQQLEVRSDSQLLIRQILGEYKVKNAGLRPLFDKVKALESQFSQIQWRHVRREENQRADQLANLALGRGEVQRP